MPENTEDLPETFLVEGIKCCLTLPTHNHGMTNTAEPQCNHNSVVGYRRSFKVVEP